MSGRFLLNIAELEKKPDEENENKLNRVRQ